MYKVALFFPKTCSLIWWDSFNSVKDAYFYYSRLIRRTITLDVMLVKFIENSLNCLCFRPGAVSTNNGNKIDSFVRT